MCMRQQVYTEQKLSFHILLKKLEVDKASQLSRVGIHVEKVIGLRLKYEI